MAAAEEAEKNALARAIGAQGESAADNDAAAEAADRWAVDHWSALPADEVVNLSDRIFGLLRAIVTAAHGAAPEEGSRP